MATVIGIISIFITNVNALDNTHATSNKDTVKNAQQTTVYVDNVNLKIEGKIADVM